MAHNEHVLRSGESISTGQWLRSKNGLFQAVMQEDGNFCIYRGDSYYGVQSGLWSTKTSDGATYFTENGFHNINMQPDGNLVIRNQGGAAVWALSTNHPQIKFIRDSLAILYDDGNFAVAPQGEWKLRVFQSGVTDKIEEDVELHKVSYDLENAIDGTPGVVKTVLIQELNNPTDLTQVTTVSVTYTETKSSTWNETTTLTVGASVTVETGIPYVAEGKVEVSTEASQSFEFGETTETSKELTFLVPVAVPPQRCYLARSTYRQFKLQVPFKIAGEAKFEGCENKLPVHIEGVYEGIGCEKLRTEYLDITTSPELKPAIVGATLSDTGDLDRHDWHPLPTP
jgi:hypothetical protein